MARTVADSLKVRNQLIGFRTGLQGLDWDTTRLVAELDYTLDEIEALAGAAVFPPGTDQSRVIKYENETLRFNRVTGHFERIDAEDPANIFLPTATGGTNGGTNGGTAPNGGTDGGTGGTAGGGGGVVGTENPLGTL